MKRQKVEKFTGWDSDIYMGLKHYLESHPGEKIIQMILLAGKSLLVIFEYEEGDNIINDES